MPVLPRGAYWDRMYHTLQGRYGANDFYKHFWPTVKDTILHTYHVRLKPTKIIDLSTEHRNNTKPNLIWALRVLPPGVGSGMARTRVDMNTPLIEKAFSQYFNFKFLTSKDFDYHAGSSDARFELTRHTLSKISHADVLVGQHGANLWNALFLKEHAMFVELKGYMGFENFENGATLASHNNLAYYMSDIRGVERAGVGMDYTEGYLQALAREVYEAWQSEQNMARKISTNSESVKITGECDFQWPEKTDGRVLSSTRVSRCYLTQVKRGTWMQLKQRLPCYYEPCSGAKKKETANQFKNDVQFCGDLCVL